MCSSKFRCVLVDVGVVSIARLDVDQTTITNLLARNQSERSRETLNSTKLCVPTGGFEGQENHRNIIYIARFYTEKLQNPYLTHEHLYQTSWGSYGYSYRDKLTRDAHVEPRKFLTTTTTTTLTHSPPHKSQVTQSPSPRKKPEILKRGERLQLISSTVLASTSVKKGKRK
jgi:hypothetical protein